MHKTFRISVLCLGLTLGATCTFAQQKEETQKGAGLNQKQSNSDNKQSTPAEIHDNASKTITVDGTIRIISEPDSQENTNHPKSFPPTIWSRAFGPPTWSQWILAIFAGIAAYFGIGAFIASRRQADAAEQMLRLTHRPKIIVRGIVIPNLPKLNRKTPMVELSTELTGYYTVANIGGLRAEITKIVDGTWIERDLPMERPDRGNPGRVEKITLISGESREIVFGAINLSVNDAISLINSEMSIYFMVRIEYLDESNTRRETSACRRFDPKLLRFAKVEDSDYEYSD